jgi:flagellar biosynthetic protein FliP
VQKLRKLVVLLIIAAALALVHAGSASAQVAPVDPDTPVATAQTATTTTTIVPAKTDTVSPTSPTGPTGPSMSPTNNGTASINLDLGNALAKPSQSILIIILITVLSVAPALLIMLTSFTRIIIVLTLTRNALGISSIPPNQVLVGLALFLSLFIMGPTFTAMNKDGIQPYINGKITQEQAYTATTAPLKTFMLKHVRNDELSLFVNISKEKPATQQDVQLNALIPAYILSEIKTAFIIGFVIFIPFLVIDIIVSSSLMSMGMMMLPPQMISLPFKLLLFVLVDGWALVIKALITSFN